MADQLQRLMNLAQYREDVLRLQNQLRHLEKRVDRKRRSVPAVSTWRPPRIVKINRLFSCFHNFGDFEENT